MSFWTKCFSLLAIVCCSITFPQNAPRKIKEPLLPTNQESCYFCQPCLQCAYNSSGRVEVQSNWDMYFSGSYILWQPQQKGLEYGYFYPNDNREDISPLNIDLNYCSGFKASLCTKLDHDSWTLSLEYTRFHHKKSGSHEASSRGYIIPSNIYYSSVDDKSTNNHSSFCKSKRRLTYDMIDLELGRPCYVGKHLIINPFFGARGGWIEQKNKDTALFTNLKINQKAPLKEDSHSRTNAWLLGPRIGVDSNWLIGCRFKLFGNIAASLNYQFFKTSFKQSSFTNKNLLDINAKDKIGHVTPNIDLGLGLGWGAYFDKSKWHVELGCLYDFLFFWNQNYSRAFSDKILRDITTKPGSFVLHGLTTRLRFDF